MDVNLKIDPGIYNEAYIPLLRDDTRTQIIYGGSSSGKSYFVIGQRMVIDLLKGGRNYLSIRNVGKTLKGSIFNEAVKGISRLKANHLFSINKTDMTITCKNGYQAILSGLDDVEKIKSITPQKGVLTDILIEEATETQEDDIKQLRRRLRGIEKYKGQIIKKRITMLFNPVYRTHWIYRKYFAGKWSDDDKFYKDDNLLILKTTYLDNLKHLAPEDILELTDETSPYWYDVYTLGNWGVLGDLVFTNWRVQDLSKIRESFNQYRNGLDFGYSNDPTAAIRSSLFGGRKQLYITDEMIYEKGLTNNVIADMLKPYIDREYIRCDSAEPKSIAELRELGINAQAALKGPGSVLYGIQYLQQHEIIIDKSCQNTINEFQLYQWDKDKDGNAINRPVDKFNHSIDGIRYAYDDVMRREPTDVNTSKAGLGLF